MIASILFMVGFSGLLGIGVFRLSCKPFNFELKQQSEYEALTAPNSLHVGRVKRQKAQAQGPKLLTFQRTSQALERMLPQSPQTFSSMRMKLRQAGLFYSPSQWRARVAVACCFCCAACTFLVGVLKGSSLAMVLAIPLGFLIAFVASRIYLQHAISRRKAQITASLPNAIELLATIIQAGCPLERGIMEVGNCENDQSVGEIAREFARVNREINLTGISLEATLASMAKQCDLSEVTIVINTILQARKQGASVSSVLSWQARACRKAYFEQVKKKVNRAETWIIIPLGCCFVPAMILFAMAPTVSVLLQQLPSLF